MAEAQLSAVLTAACLVMIFTVRKLGLVIAQRDSLSTSQKAMLKQVACLPCNLICHAWQCLQYRGGCIQLRYVLNCDCWIFEDLSITQTCE